MQRDILRVVSRVPGADAAKRAADKVRATAARSSKKAAIGFLAVAGLAGLAWMTNPTPNPTRELAEGDAAQSLATQGALAPGPARVLVGAAEDTRPPVAPGELAGIAVISIQDLAQKADVVGPSAKGLGLAVKFAMVALAILMVMHGAEELSAVSSAFRIICSVMTIISKFTLRLERKRSMIVLLAFGIGVIASFGGLSGFCASPQLENGIGGSGTNTSMNTSMISREGGLTLEAATCMLEHGMAFLSRAGAIQAGLATWGSGAWDAVLNAGEGPSDAHIGNATGLLRDLDETPKMAPVVDSSLANVIETRLNDSGITGEVRSFLVSVLTDQTSHNTTLARDIRAIAVGIASGSVPPALSPDEIQRMSRHALEGGGGPFKRPEFLGDNALGNATWALVHTRIGTSRRNTSHYAYLSSDADRGIITLTPPVATALETVTLTLGGIIAASARPAPAGFALALNPGLGGLNSYYGRRGSSVIRLFDDVPSTDSLRAAGESALNLQSTLVLASAVAGLDCIYLDRVSAHALTEPKESKAPNGGAEVSETFKTWATELGGLMSVRLVLTAHLSLLFGLPDPLGWLYKEKSEPGTEMARVGYVVFRLTRALTDLRGLTSGGATGESATPALMQVVALIRTVLPATKTSEQSDTSVALADTTVRSWTSLAHGVTGSPIFLWFLEGELNLLDQAMPEKGTIAALHHGAPGLVWHAASEARRVIDSLIYEDPTNDKRIWKNFPSDIKTVESQLGAVQARMHELGTSSDSQWGRLQVLFAQVAGSLYDDPTAATPEAPSVSDADAQRTLDAEAEATNALAAKNRKAFDTVKTGLLGDVNKNKKPTTNDMVRQLILEVRFFTRDGDPFQSWQAHLGMWWNSGAVETPEFAEVAREALRGPHFQGANLPFTNDVIQILDDAASPVPTAADYSKIVSKWKTLTAATPVTPVAGAEDVAQLSEQLYQKLQSALAKKTSEEAAAKAAEAAAFGAAAARARRTRKQEPRRFL